MLRLVSNFQGLTEENTHAIQLVDQAPTGDK